MARDVLPEKLVTPARADLIRQYERDWQLRFPGAAVGPGTEPGAKARILADIVLPLYGEAARNAQVASLDDMDGGQLEDTADSLGLPRRLAAVGSSGGVTIGASLGGGTIFAGDEIKDLLTGLRWTCAATGVYTAGQAVPVVGKDAGAQTNIPAGRLLTWTSQRPGIASTATVVLQSDGSGLSGGRDLETDTDVAERIRAARANPAVAGNDADYQQAALRVPNVGLQAPFTFPCIAGPGTIGFAFTLRPAAPGGSRIPNATQRALVRSFLVGQFPKDDGLIDIALAAQATAVRLRVRWAAGARGWADASPWPAYDAANFVYVVYAGSATAFRLASADPAHADVQAGQTIGFYNAAIGAFVRKRIASVTASTSGGLRLWDVVCDSSNNASDLTYVPASGERPSPWSDSLDAVVPPIVAAFDQTGPGELFAEPYLDAGARQKRSPPNPETWPSELSGRIEAPIDDLPAVNTVRVVEPALPFATTVGTPSALAYLLELSSISAHPL
jgi:uncharacterized phage protein gp47/JayE